MENCYDNRQGKGDSEVRPADSFVASDLEALWVNKGFREKDGMGIGVLPIERKSFQVDL